MNLRDKSNGVKNARAALKHNLPWTTLLLAASLDTWASDANSLDFDLPAQSLATALDSLAKTSHTKLIYADADVQGLKAKALKGHFSVLQALDKILGENGLQYQAVGDGHAFYGGDETSHMGFAPLLVAINPTEGTVANKRFWGKFAMTWIYDLHYTLLLDQRGKIVMAVVGVIPIVSLIGDVYLWWPPLHKLKSALTIKKSACIERLNYDLHKTSGIYSLIAVAMLALTGIALEIPEYVNPIIGIFSPLQSPPKPESALNLNGKPITLDQAVDIAQRRFPDARLCWIETPDGEQGSFRINLRQATEPSQRLPKTNVWIDQYNGDILAISDAKRHSPSDELLAWLDPLHSGEALALPEHLLVLIAGLVCPVLFITGVVCWLQKRQGQQCRKTSQ